MKFEDVQRFYLSEILKTPRIELRSEVWESTKNIAGSVPLSAYGLCDKTTRWARIKPYDESVLGDISKLIFFKSKIKRICQRNRRDIDRLGLNALQTTITQKLKRHSEGAWNATFFSLMFRSEKLYISISSMIDYL